MSTQGAAAAAAFQEHRPRMFAVAYRMLGSAVEAEDVVQDAYLRWSSADRRDVAHPGAWLAKTVTRLCLNHLASARVRREEYAGPWLPEPVLTATGALGPLESAEQREGVSMALLVLLERLTPAERAVYVLREAFAYAHREIAQLLDLTEPHCRQLYHRAAGRLAEASPAPRPAPDPERWQGLVDTFLTAARDGDLARLEELLTADVRYVADGGGVVGAARRPIVGRDKVARFVLGALRKYVAGVPVTVAEVNGAPALLFGEVAVLLVAFRNGRVSDMGAVVNPEKLAYLRRQLSHSRTLSGPR
ncbi:DNA-directed RNA polymerase sigma-70 factor [Streptomyces subrutilus]|uniref:DNA-directed RNA polymerase sigma-70 factor n=2 Tax=Streptomyces subrutilus TaxID=36818 RepID=A0A918R7M2_9ACTN|nr:RNA polymerase sigma-70 factor [Streptomyces subrutilus]GGZ88143.1 DNA-directed RNA polymerase sigma-70 factor [Streptomyces subrutilus]